MPLREIAGPAGRLEALLDEPAGRRGVDRDGLRRAPATPAACAPRSSSRIRIRSTAARCTRRSVYQAAKALARIGCAVLRFNFRGVGASAGTFDDGAGEHGRLPRRARLHGTRAIRARRCGPAGFSFGSWVALTVGADDPRVSTLHRHRAAGRRATTSTPVARSTKPKFFIQGELDELCPLKDMRAFYAQLRGAEGAGRHRRAPITCSTARSARSATRSRICWATSAEHVERHMNDAVIVSAVRTAVGKAPNGTLRGTRPDELAAVVDRAKRSRARPALDPAEIDDVILGCAMPEAEQGLNVARIASLRAGIPVDGVGGHRQPLLLVGPAGDRLRRRAHHVRLRVGASSPAAPSR